MKGILSSRNKVFTAVLSLFLGWPAAIRADDRDTAALASEVKSHGWIVFSARSAAGDWDLFACRPDGSENRNLTNTPDSNEGYALLSRDGTRLLYRRTKRAEKFDGNHHGEQGELMLSKSDGTEARALGADGELPWASWSPDGKQIATLSLKGIAFIDLATGQTVRTLKRNGFFQQLTWSPDGKWLSGVSNALGASWKDARMNVETGETNAVSLEDCCTPDWFPDSTRFIYSSRTEKEGNKGYGWTRLMMANADGTDRRLVYAEEGRHIYGGHVSPDGKYVLFTGNAEENGDSKHAGAPMGLIRLSDAPVIVGENKAAREKHPQAKGGPVLKLPDGWEPCWTLHEIFDSKK
jgi:Tol biopolymer transport system component